MNENRVINIQNLIPVFIIGIIVISQFFFYERHEFQLVSDYVAESRGDILSLIMVSQENKNTKTMMLYDMLIDENVEALMAEVIENPHIKDSRRQILKQWMEDPYEAMTNTGIYQFQFHLPGTISFLRLHRTESFDDDLTNIRETVTLTQKNNKHIMGYEEGRVLGGYRYVYPIHYEGELVGSVEFSYDAKHMIKPVEKTYGLTSIHLVTAEEVGEKTFDEVKDEYVWDKYTDLGYLSPISDYQQVIDGLKISQEDFRRLNNLLVKEVAQSDSQEAEVYLTVDQSTYWAMTVPIDDFTGQHVGWYIFYKKDDVLNSMLSNRKYGIWINVVLTILLLLLLLYAYRLFLKTKKKAMYDELTGLHNRHAFTERQHNGLNNSVAFMMDIDDFKETNDTHGHMLGDKILRGVAHRIRNQIRKEDIAVRWGGEEFLVIFTGITMATAEIRAKKLLTHISDNPIEGVLITISIGVASIKDDVEKGISDADEALYEAKKQGKNRYVIR